MSSPLRLRPPESAKQISVIEVCAARGSGLDTDPVRSVTQYWSLDGELLAERDSWSQK
ncbi:MAG TPA: hypothetical protein VNG95_01965 [Gemmatimonadales bacterium]|nr:hypothetical protein [Gemmatimonadales bacterium]